MSMGYLFQVLTLPVLYRSDHSLKPVPSLHGLIGRLFTRLARQVEELVLACCLGGLLSYMNTRIEQGQLTYRVALVYICRTHLAASDVCVNYLRSCLCLGRKGEREGRGDIASCSGVYLELVVSGRVWFRNIFPSREDKRDRERERRERGERGEGNACWQHLDWTLTVW